MSTVTTTRPVNVGQLSTELGDAPLSMTDYGTERTIECYDDAVTQQVLEAAIDAHVAGPEPDPEPVEPPPPSFDSRIQAQVDDLADMVFMLAQLEGDL